jgi:DNA-binding beta-propeller fold protein YncE
MVGTATAAAVVLGWLLTLAVVPGGMGLSGHDLPPEGRNAAAPSLPRAMTSFAVRESLDLVSGNLTAGLRNGTALDGPGPIAFAGVPGVFAVAGTENDRLGLVEVPQAAAPGRILRTVELPAPIVGLASDPATGTLWAVTRNPNGSGAILRLNDTLTVAWAAPVPAVGDPAPILLAPDANELFVAGSGADVFALNASTGALNTGYPVGNGPTAVAYDAAAQLLFVANELSGNVTVLNVSTGASVRSVAVPTNPLTGPRPLAMVYDPESGWAYVADAGNPNLTAFPALGASPPISLPLPQPAVALASDPMTGARSLLVVGSNGNLSILNESDDQLAGNISLGPAGYPLQFPSLEAAFDPNDGAAAVDTFVGGAVWTVAPRPFSAEGPEPLAYDPSGFAFAATGAMGVATTSRGALLLEGPNGGAPEGTVALGGSPGSVAALDDEGAFAVADVSGYSVAEANGSSPGPIRSIPVGAVVPEQADPMAFALDPATDQLWVTSLASSSIAVLDPVTGIVARQWSVPGGPISIAYDPGRGTMFVGMFPPPGDLGQPARIAWYAASNATLLGSVSLPQVGPDSIPAPVAMAYCAGPDRVYFVGDGIGGGDAWALDPSNGTLSGPLGVGGVPDLVGCPDEGSNIYFVGRASSGWNVTVFDATLWRDVAFVPVGPDPVAIADDPSRGQMAVLSSEDSTIDLLGGSAPPQYPVRFTASGPSLGSGWNVTFLGHSWRSETGTLVAGATNGTWPFTVEPPTGEIAVPAAGNVTVAGAGTNLTLTFSRPAPTIDYTITFRAVGLPNGTAWSVVLGNVTLSGRSLSLAGSAPNGTVPFRVLPPGNYTVAPSAGNLTVAGAALNETLTFRPTSSPGPSRPGGSGPPGPPWEAYVLVAAAASAGTLVGVLWARRRRPSGP